MRPAYLVADIRTAEAAVMARVAPDALMLRAATGLAIACATWLRGRGIGVVGAEAVLLVGSGNNGGDALHAGAWLARRGARVRALLLSDSPHAGGAAALRRAGGRLMSAADDPAAAEAVTAAADLVLDGIVGIGGAGPLRPEAARLARAARGRTVAVDLPSGIDPDTGEVPESQACVAAELTVTFGALKPGLVLPDGRWQAGQVHLVDIGLGPELAGVEPAVLAVDVPGAAALVPQPGRDDDKYTRGVLGVVAGSAAYPGAGVLCTGAARLGGVGMVRYAGAALAAVVSRWPEIVPSHEGPARAGRTQGWVVGPGAGTDDAAAERLREALALDVPVLVDADGITLVAERADLRAAVVARSAATLFTPHAGEFARLGGNLAAPGGRAGAVRALAAELNSVVLLKGAATLVAAAQGPVAVSASGPPDLATAGSGDVLSGLTGSIIAAQRQPVDDALLVRCAAAGAYLHGLAGRLAAQGRRPVVAEDVLAEVPAAIGLARSILADGPRVGSAAGEPGGLAAGRPFGGLAVGDRSWTQEVRG